jgi:two-component system sensor histidine kinase ArlS
MHNVGRLLSLISHEVRAPVGVMRGYMRLLEQQGTELSEQHRHAVSAALKAGERATELLNQVSALARLHRGEITLSLAPAPLEPVLRAAAHAVVMPPDPIITVHIGETPQVSVMADGEMLRGAFAGLTSAVVRAQATDSRIFLLSRDQSRDGERGVVVTITAMEAVSETYVEQPLDVSRGGLGLELPIAAFLIDAHRGQVMERREQNRFIGVVVWLPVV